MTIQDAITLAQSLYNSGDLSVDQADPILSALGEAQGEITRLKSMLDQERAHIPGKYAFLHRHYAMMFVRQKDPELHAWAGSEAGQKLDREGGTTYEDYVGKIEQERDEAIQHNAALLGILRELDYSRSPEEAEHLLSRVRASEHPGQALMGQTIRLLAAARAYRAAVQACDGIADAERALFKAVEEVGK